MLLHARRTKKKPQRYLSPWARNSRVSNCLVSSCDEIVIVTVTEDICDQGIKPGGPDDVKFVVKTLLPYYLNKKWLTKDPPKGQKSLYGTIAITPFSFYFSRLGKGGRQDCQEVPQGFIQLLCRKRPESCRGLCERLRRWLDGERY